MVDLGELLGGKKRVPKWLLNLGERYLGFHRLNVAHYNIDDDMDNGSPDNFFQLACRHLDLNYELNEGGLENIPEEGPCVIVANHPHGLSDGIMFGDVVMKRRKDVRIIVNDFLNCVHGMRDYTITVNVYGGEEAVRANMSGMREMIKWLRQGHCVLVFPSGSAATYSAKDKRVIDDPWQSNIASIIRKMNATVVPMHISGRTGLFFQMVSVMCKGKRANLLPREIKRDGRMPHQISLGKPISPHILSSFDDDHALADYLRLRTMLLNYKFIEEKSSNTERELKPIDPHINPQLIIDELSTIPPEALYYDNDKTGLQIYIIKAQFIPNIMQEIAVQREEVFRIVGEGSGESKDIDEYDSYCNHLFMWDTRSQRVIGAYRMGLTDEILDQRGCNGLYNGAFFKMKPELQDQLRHGLEMGRAYIIPEHQKLPASLDTLWMGIGRFMKKHPQYYYLYGTVSISSHYQWLSRSLIISYLKENQMNEDMAKLIRPKSPPPKEMTLRSEDSRLLPRALADSRVLSQVINDIEDGKQGIPVLLKHYLRLNGKMIAFNIDESFGNTLDGFVVVNMDEAPDRMRKRYRGDTI